MEYMFEFTGVITPRNPNLSGIRPRKGFPGGRGAPGRGDQGACSDILDLQVPVR
jgi:hypothetical protein